MHCGGERLGHNQGFVLLAIIKDHHWILTITNSFLLFELKRRAKCH